MKNLIVIFSLSLMVVTWAYFRHHREYLQRIYSQKMITVKVLGNVNNPGIYEVPEGSLIEELIDKAGGQKKVENSLLNPDKELLNGQVVTIGKEN